MSEFEKVTIEAMALPSESRANLAEILIQSLDEEENEDIKSAWLADVSRRDQEIRSGLSVTKPADQVINEARKQLRCIK